MLALGYAAPVLAAAGRTAMAAVQTSADGAHRWPLEGSVSIVAHSEAVREARDCYNMAAAFGDPLLTPAGRA